MCRLARLDARQVVEAGQRRPQSMSLTAKRGRGTDRGPWKDENTEHAATLRVFMSIRFPHAEQRLAVAVRHDDRRRKTKGRRQRRGLFE